MNNRHFFLKAAVLSVLLVSGIRPVLGTEVGVLGGLTYSRFSSPDLAWRYQLSYSAGAFANLRWNRFLRLQTELRFTTSSSGAVIPIKYFSYSQDVKLTRNIQAVELPLILQILPFNGRKIQPFFQSGAYGAVNIRGNDRLESQGQSHMESFNDELKRFNAGFLIGAGVDIHIGQIPFHLSGLWRIALNPIAIDNLGQKINSTGFLISLGLGLWNFEGRAQ